MSSKLKAISLSLEDIETVDESKIRDSRIKYLDSILHKSRETGKDHFEVQFPFSLTGIDHGSGQFFIFESVSHDCTLRLANRLDFANFMGGSLDNLRQARKHWAQVGRVSSQYIGKSGTPCLITHETLDNTIVVSLGQTLSETTPEDLLSALEYFMVDEILRA